MTFKTGDEVTDPDGNTWTVNVASDRHADSGVVIQQSVVLIFKSAPATVPESAPD